MRLPPAWMAPTASMGHVTRLAQAALLAVSFLVPAPAAADSSAAATMSAMGIRLTDLDAADGRSPQIQFIGGPSHHAHAGYVSFEWGLPLCCNRVLRQADSLFGTVTLAAVTASGGRIEASVTGDGTLGGTTLAVRGASISGHVADSAFFVGASLFYDRDDAYSTRALWLSPQTRVELHGLVELVAQVRQAPGWTLPEQDAAWGYGRVFLQSDALTVMQEVQLADTGPVRVSVSLDNTSDRWIRLGADLDVGIHVRSAVASPIPEPPGGLLGVLGLAVLALARYSRAVPRQTRRHRWGR